MATKYSYEALGPEYQRLWDSMRIIRDATELNRLTNKIKANQSVYQKVQDEIGVPWQMVAVIHVREAGEQDIGAWNRCLHNGERIIGTGRKTKLVPAGRGPFKTWHEATIDALKLKGFDKIPSWPASRMLWGLEPYNGYGYRLKGLRSPYLWASTNHQQPGKFVADHVFDSNVMDTQIGCAALLKFLGVEQKATSVVTVSQTPSSKTRPAEGGALATVSVGGAMMAFLEGHTTEILIGSAIAAALVYFVIRRYRARKEEIIAKKVTENVGSAQTKVD